MILSNGAVIQVESNGSYHITSASGGSFAVGPDGTVLFTAKQEQAATHIVRQKTNAILEVIESDGMTTIQISNTGGTSIVKSVGEAESEDVEKCPKADEPQSLKKVFRFIKLFSITNFNFCGILESV